MNLSAFDRHISILPQTDDDRITKKIENETVLVYITFGPRKYSEWVSGLGTY